jgi:hypothetical protein
MTLEPVLGEDSRPQGAGATNESPNHQMKRTAKSSLLPVTGEGLGMRGMDAPVNVSKSSTRLGSNFVGAADSDFR